MFSHRVTLRGMLRKGESGGVSVSSNAERLFFRRHIKPVLFKHFLKIRGSRVDGIRWENNCALEDTKQKVYGEFWSGFKIGNNRGLFSGPTLPRRPDRCHLAYSKGYTRVYFSKIQLLIPAFLFYTNSYACTVNVPNISL